ncbi:hypothetical protein [Mycobacterium marinum]|uniref:hypothetical protein n=1 Tax=Mycobacterium marinum TaxID=1781 RepID=UPI00356140C5
MAQNEPEEAQNTTPPTLPRPPTGLRARGKRLWRELHESAEFDHAPETVLVIEEACFLADEVDRLRRIVRAAGADTRVLGYNKQITSMPEVDDLRKTQALLLSMLKSIRLDDEMMTASDFGRRGAEGRWR